VQQQRSIARCRKIAGFSGKVTWKLCAQSDSIIEAMPMISNLLAGYLNYGVLNAWLDSRFRHIVHKNLP
jgi:hypothetical protein